ncbi:MAG: transporter substrate-binding domain-containing protein [Lachnospiraceae bacterium]|nr:transporter substrate-binding domain-containing protein [Lachnospiraceae bacterium]
MKKKTALLLVLSLLASVMFGCGSSAQSAAETADAPAAEESAAAEESTPAEESAAAEDSDWAYVQSKGKVTVGITMFAPMNYEEDGKLVGFDTELTQAVFDKLGVEPEFIEINWDSKEVELNSKNIDCIWNGMCITEERKQNMTMSDPYLLNTQALVMKADREEEIMADVSGLSLVAEAGSTGEGKVDGSIPDDDTVVVSAHEFFKDTNYTPVDSMAKALMEVKAGTADLAIVDSVCALAMVGEGTDYDDLIVNLDNNFGEQEYGIAFRKGSDMAAMVNDAINELYADGTVASIAEKYGLSEILVSR